MGTKPRRPLVLLVALASLVAPHALASNWPTFRGPGSTGVADGQNLPTSWDVKSGRNVLWKAAIPGLGHSSPVVWEDRIFITTAVTTSATKPVLGDEGGIRLADDREIHSWRLYSVSAKDGSVLWEREVDLRLPPVKRHVKSSQANCTPATDGKIVVAAFPTGTLAAYDLAGNAKWRADLGILNPGLYNDAWLLHPRKMLRSWFSEWGYASSPILFENLAIVQVDRHRGSFLAAFNLASGKRVWTVDRDEKPVWSTPVVVRAGGRDELVVSGGNYARAYDPRTGKELWRFKDDAEVKIPSPFISDGLIVFAGGHRGRPMYALKPGGTGDISVATSAASSPHLAWRTEPGGPYSSTPVAYHGILFGVRDEGVLVAYDMSSGQRIFRDRTNLTHSASLIASDGYIYVAAETGEVLVVKAALAYSVVARNDMGESVMATPAIANGVLYIRTSGHLYALASAPATDR